MIEKLKQDSTKMWWAIYAAVLFSIAVLVHSNDAAKASLFSSSFVNLVMIALISWCVTTFFYNLGVVIIAPFYVWKHSEVDVNIKKDIFKAMVGVVGEPIGRVIYIVVAFLPFYLTSKNGWSFLNIYETLIYTNQNVLVYISSIEVIQNNELFIRLSNLTANVLAVVLHGYLMLGILSFD